MIERVISGGQTGVDQAAWRAAQGLGIPTGGWMPLGFRTEGPNGKKWGEHHPEFASLYGAQEHPSANYPPRTLANVGMADVTLWYGDGDSAGFYSTQNAARKLYKAFWLLDQEPPEIARLLILRDYRIVNCAGPRGSTLTQHGETVAYVEEYFTRLFRLLR